MPNELTVQAVQAVSGSAEKPADPKVEPFVQPQVPAGGETPQPFTNPTLRLDPGLGLVVIEFRDASGNLTSSIPSQRQIEAYRLHEQPLPGQQRHPQAHGSATTSIATAATEAPPAGTHQPKK